MTHQDAGKDPWSGRILELLDQGRLEQAAEEAQVLFRQLRLDLGGCPVDLTSLLDEAPSGTKGDGRQARAKALTRRAHARWLYGLIQLLRKEDAREDLERAFADLNAASCLDERDAMSRVRLANNMLFSARYVRALRLRPCADLGTAKREFKAALRLDPTCVPAHHGLGFLRLTTAQGQRLSGLDPQRSYARAMDSFTAAIRLDTGHARSHQNLGIAKAALARHRAVQGAFVREALIEAVQDLERALDLDPALARASYKSAQLLMELGDTVRAGAFLQRCRDLRTLDEPRLALLEGRLTQSCAPQGAVVACVRAGGPRGEGPDQPVSRSAAIPCWSAISG